MEIKYKNEERYDDFFNLNVNESFLYEGEVYTKIELCLYRKRVDPSANTSGDEKNAIRLKDMTFYNFSAGCKVKLVKVKATVED